mmetsp:Transcript_31213/g.36069  ORF Transcript_31213/g.36069 Transcript_31213/m.36069 type:complete len:352 (+) Transcript_31213:21-1076(+)
MDYGPNDLIPRMFVDIVASVKPIEEFIRLCLGKKPEANQKIEIEAKLGYAPRMDKLTAEQQQFLQANYRRDKDYVILDTTEKNLSVAHPNIPVDKSQLREDFFRRALKYMEIENAKDPNKVVRPGTSGDESTLLLLDFSGYKSRITYDCYKNKWTRSTKSERKNLDYSHRGNIIRITGSLEVNENVEEKDIKFDEFNFIRVKLRDVFRFQFMEFSFTEVYELSLDSKNIDVSAFFEKLVNEFPKMLPYTRVLEVMKGVCGLRMTKGPALGKYEIECEIVEPELLMSALAKPDDYSAFVKRFLRCVDSVFQASRFIFTQISKEYLGFERTAEPEISHYLISIYKDHLLEKKK